MTKIKHVFAVFLCLSVIVQTGWAQRFTLFSPDIKKDYPSVVYDFLETYLYRIDQMQSRGESVVQRLSDDKVQLITGTASTARTITPVTPFSVTKTGGGYYLVEWTNEQSKSILSLSFPMQYELLLGKPKVEIEKEFRAALTAPYPYTPRSYDNEKLCTTDDGCQMTVPQSNYYVKTMTTATYFRTDSAGVVTPAFSDKDKWHSAANLLLGCIKDVDGYSLYVEQNLYGFRKEQYRVALKQWLSYCQAMKLDTYFAVEEERADGLKALLIAHSEELGFNHMLSLIIPDDFVTNRNAVLKVSLNAYIPTQNVKDMYQKYIDKPKKKI